MKNYSKQKNKNIQGFTLVETLVAVSIFSMSLVMVMVILGQGIADTGYAKQKVSAEYLAQEGIEYIRNVRDTYILNYADAQTGWTNFKTLLSVGVPGSTTGCYSLNGCYFNDTPAIVACSGGLGNCPVLTYDSTNGKYGYSGNLSSGFTRKITVTNISADEVRVSSSVSWTQASGLRQVIFKEDLFNWVE